jgi:hypothetical protein
VITFTVYSDRDAIDRISESAPRLAEHLNETVKTGTFCSYRPEPEHGPQWSLDTRAL